MTDVRQSGRAASEADEADVIRLDLARAVDLFEKRFILRVLTKFKGSLTKTAEALGMHRNTLTRKMGEYKIKRRAG